MNRSSKHIMTRTVRVWSAAALVLAVLPACTSRRAAPEDPSGSRPSTAATPAPPSDSPAPMPGNQPVVQAPAELAPVPPAGATVPGATAAPAVPTTSEAADASEARRELFPGVFVDLKHRAVDFEGVVPIDVNDPATPVVYMEAVVCIPDTKEHESLVMVTAKPSHVHAALLLIGLRPGKPGGWRFENEQLVAIDPVGDEVQVTISYAGQDGTRLERPPQDMIVSLQGDKHFGERDAGHWVFAGSRVVTRQGREWYDADGAGVLVGLATFGGETIAWSKTISPDSNIQEPEWIADRARVPPVGTAVRVTIRPAAK